MRCIRNNLIWWSLPVTCDGCLLVFIYLSLLTINAIIYMYYLIVNSTCFIKYFFIFNYIWCFGFLVFYYLTTFDLYCDWSKQSWIFITNPKSSLIHTGLQRVKAHSRSRLLCCKRQQQWRGLLTFVMRIWRQFLKVRTRKTPRIP